MGARGRCDGHELVAGEGCSKECPSRLLWLILGTEETLDAHHITDRNLMPNGGYTLANGISLCPPCHEKAEVFHSTGTALPGFSPDDLYRIIRG